MNNFLFALGASDPEMEQIQKLLTDAGVPFVYATKDGRRVRPECMYEADDVAGATHWVECSPRAGVRCLVCGDTRHGATWAGVGDLLPGCDQPQAGGMGPCGDLHTWPVMIDHHRPGDPGYGCGANAFLAASSIGQVIAALAVACALPPAWRLMAPGSATPCPRGCEYEEFRPPQYGDFFHQPKWVESTWVVASDKAYYAVPKQFVLAAAADHCLAAAYQGQCPGVAPDALMQWRAQSRAAFQGRSVESVLADIEQARLALMQADDIFIEIGPAGGHDMDYIRLRDMRGQHVPELPEASAREGICFIADGLPGPDGRVKVVCQSGTPEQIRMFMDVWAPTQKLAGIYGDPQRGFAGGYVWP